MASRSTTSSDAPERSSGRSISRRQRGERAEALAEAFLIESGYRVVARNARVERGEIDRIALDGHVLCFVEVRSRASWRFGSAEASVDVRKQQRVIRAARAWLAENRAPAHTAIRFDVVTVDARSNTPRLALYRAAFVADRR